MEKDQQPVFPKGPTNSGTSLAPRQPPTLLQARFGGGRMEKVLTPVDRHC
jgi:hypothetical protein